MGSENLDAHSKFFRYFYGGGRVFLISPPISFCLALMHLTEAEEGFLLKLLPASSLKRLCLRSKKTFR